MGALRIMVEADLERDQSLAREVEALHEPALVPVPKMETLAVFSSSHIIQIEAGNKGLGRPEFAAHHDVVAWLVPEVVVVAHPLGTALPAPGDFKVLVEEQKAARPVPLAVAKHGDHHVPISQAVNGVRRTEVGFYL